jgi:ABC-type ATPase involved in cell division
MDAESEIAVRALLLELRRSGSTLLFSAHDEGLVKELSDRIVRFDDGRATSDNQGDLE